VFIVRKGHKLPILEVLTTTSAQENATFRLRISNQLLLMDLIISIISSVSIKSASFETLAKDAKFMDTLKKIKVKFNHKFKVFTEEAEAKALMITLI
jgi:hypothetical protein